MLTEIPTKVPTETGQMSTFIAITDSVPTSRVSDVVFSRLCSVRGVRIILYQIPFTTQTHTKSVVNFVGSVNTVGSSGKRPLYFRLVDAFWRLMISRVFCIRHLLRFTHLYAHATCSLVYETLHSLFPCLLTSVLYRKVLRHQVEPPDFHHSLYTLNTCYRLTGLSETPTHACHTGRLCPLGSPVPLGSLGSAVATATVCPLASPLPLGSPVATPLASPFATASISTLQKILSKCLPPRM